MKLNKINVEFLLDTDPNLGVTDLQRNEPYRNISKDVDYTIESDDEIEQMQDILCKEVEELKDLHDEISFVGNYDDEFLVLCGACTLDFKPVPPQLQNKQTKDNPTLYISIHMFVKE